MRRTPAALAAASLLLVAGPAAGQSSAAIELQTTKGRVAVGEVFEVQVVRRGPEHELREPRLGTAFQEIGRSNSMQMAFKNNKRARQEVLTLRLRAVRPGKHELAGAAMLIEGAVLSEARPLVIEAEAGRAPKSESGLGLFVDVSPKKPYVGEAFTVEVFLVNAAGGAVRLPQVRETSRPAALIVLGDSTPRRSLFPDKYIGERTTLMTRSYIATAHGEVPLPTFRAPMHTSGSDLLSPAGTIRIRQLPGAGRPLGFAPGNIGRFQVEAAIVDDSDRPLASVSLDQAVTLKATITGQGSLALVAPPMVKLGDAFRPAENVGPFHGPDRLDSGTRTGERVFRWSLVASRSGPVTVPEVKLATFDPGTDRYTLVTPAGAPAAAK